MDEKLRLRLFVKSRIRETRAALEAWQEVLEALDSLDTLQPLPLELKAKNPFFGGGILAAGGASEKRAPHRQQRLDRIVRIMPPDGRTASPAEVARLLYPPAPSEAQRRATGRDMHTLVADGLLESPAHGRFKLVISPEEEVEPEGSH